MQGYLGQIAPKPKTPTSTKTADMGDDNSHARQDIIASTDWPLHAALFACDLILQDWRDPYVPGQTAGGYGRSKGAKKHKRRDSDEQAQDEVVSICLRKFVCTQWRLWVEACLTAADFAQTVC